MSRRKNTSLNHEIFLGEKEISDVSLSTFYVFDKEDNATPRVGEKVAWGCRCGCGGCRCGSCRWGWRGCWGCGGRGGCCWSLGALPLVLDQLQRVDRRQ